MPDEPWELNNTLCPLCGAVGAGKTLNRTLGPLDLWVECRSCGSYEISHQAARSLQFVDYVHYGKKHLLSAITRAASDRGEPATIIRDKIEQLLQSVTVPADHVAAMDRILLYVSRKQETAAAFVDLSYRDYPVAFAKNGAEFHYYLHNLVSMAYLERLPGTPETIRLTSMADLERLPPPTVTYRLTPAGWQRVMELRKTEGDSDQAFVAMWFTEELDPIWNEGFEPALREVGYHPIRIDLVPHNDKICDRIEAEIRRSGLVVADMTGNRGGVYFEAGLARGLSIPVIWTCREDYVDKLHFDTRQYNHLVWKDAIDLKESLIFRIEATIPGRVRTSGAPAT